MIIYVELFFLSLPVSSLLDKELVYLELLVFFFGPSAPLDLALLGSSAPRTKQTKRSEVARSVSIGSSKMRSLPGPDNKKIRRIHIEDIERLTCLEVHDG